jgi:hypothetical protein
MVLVVISKWRSRTLAIVNASRSFLVCIAQTRIVTRYVPNLMSMLLIGLGWIAASWLTSRESLNWHVASLLRSTALVLVARLARVEILYRCRIRGRGLCILRQTE